MTRYVKLDFLPEIQVQLEKMGFIQQALELVVKNQVGLRVGLSKTTTNKGSSCF
jgi:hypothetical protein